MQTRKSLLVTLFLFTVSLVISAGFVFLRYNLEFLHNDVEVAKASPSGDVVGWAWSPNAGWISLNCQNDASCGSVNFGVSVDPATGNFSGYGWSSIYGWVDFAPAGPYPSVGTIYNYSARWATTTGNVTGWAKILLLGDNGWIKMSDNNVPLWSGYGVTISTSTGQFRGWASNLSSDGSGIGWISFSSLDSAGSPAYQATLLVPPSPGANSVILSGYAWNAQTGWISVNCSNDASCSTSNYSVFFDKSTGNFAGYAWSSNLGWIDFAPSGSPPDGGTIAHWSSSTNAITGWAKILSMGNNGWIKMSDENAVTGWPGNGTRLDTSAGQLRGYAWNYNSDGSGIGWISFNSLDSGSAVPYVVTFAATPPTAPTIPGSASISQSTTPGATCKTITISWTDNSNNETGFKAQTSLNGTSGWTDLCTNSANSTSCFGVVSPNTTYYFRVGAMGDLGAVAWSNVVGPVTTTYCAPNVGQPGAASNCDQVILNWTPQGTGINYYEIYKATSSTFTRIATTSSAVTTYTDTNVQSGMLYSYYMKAQNANLQSNTIGPFKPCPDLPSWREIKPQ